MLESAIKARSAALVQLGDLIVTAPREFRERLGPSPDGTGEPVPEAPPCPEPLGEPVEEGSSALVASTRIDALDAEIAVLDETLGALVGRAAPRTTALLRVGTLHAAQLLVSAGQNIDRLHGEAAFAPLLRPQIPSPPPRARRSGIG